uniref:Apolipoprotein L, 1 n=1 Tax=Hucho hucho TaxID=62062 RepID=A0A4W5QF73_9TELE
MAKPPPLVPHPRNICMGKPEESEPQRRWSYDPSPSDPSGPGLGEGRLPPPVPHHRKIYIGKPEESEPQRRWSYGPSSPSHTSGPAVDKGRKPGTAQKPPPVTRNKWSVGRNPPQEGGCDPQDGGSVSEFIKKFEAKEDQNKQLVLRRPLGPPAVIDREDSDSPLYEKVLATQETRTFGSPAVVDREESNDYIYEEVFVTQETRTVTVQQRICATYADCIRPPPLPLKQSLPLKDRINTLSISSISEEEKEQDNIKDAALLEWWGKVKSEPWKDLSNDPKLAKKGEAKLFKEKAQRFQNALQLYNLLLTKHGETLKNYIIDLLSIADNLDKVSKRTKIAGITGGATGGVGGVAAAAGVILAPFTLGLSLALTVVGVGVAAAGGVTGASAAIANKVSSAQDRKKIELILQDYLALMGDIEACLRFINVGMEHLRKHNHSTLQEVDTKAVRVARVAMVTGVGSSSAIDASSKASGMLQGFALGMDIYFTQKDGEGGPTLGKGLESKFGRKIREVAQQLNEGLDEVIKVKYKLVENNLIL